MIELKGLSALILKHLSIEDFTVLDESSVDMYNLVSKNNGNISGRSASKRIGPVSPTHPEMLVQHAELFAVGDRYDAKLLREAATIAFRHHFELIAGDLDFKILSRSVIKMYTQTTDSVCGLRDTVKAALSRPPFHHWLKEELFDELLKESDSVAVRRAFGVAVGPADDDVEVRASLPGVCDITCR